MKKINSLLLGVLGAVLLGTQTGHADPIIPDLPEYNSGAQLNQALDYMERERIAQQIEEDKARLRSQVDTSGTGDTDVQQSSETMLLKGVENNQSQVLEQSEIDAITAEYVGKDVTVSDLYRMVEKINLLYEGKGFVTCRAFVLAQEIKDNVIQITLIEGKTGEVSVTGNRWTNSDYITDRLHLTKGEIANVNTLNKDLLRFNASNDVQLRIAMKAGKEEGTTDYVLEAVEPNQYMGSIWMDNGGSYTTGEFRTGMFFNARNVSGLRDSVGVGLIYTKGTWAGSANYSQSIGLSGTKFNMSVSGNSIKVVKGDYDILDIRGHSSAYNFSIVQPWIINAKARSEISLGFNHQESTTELRAINIVNTDNLINDYTLAFAATDYGSSHVFYQKHSLMWGKSRDAANSDNREFRLYKFNSIYQKAYQHGQSITFKMDGQWTDMDYLPTARQFYMGGSYSVRGYKENFKGGDSGVFMSAEYAVPLNKERTVTGYGFFDVAHSYGQTTESDIADRMLSSVGLGVRATVDKRYYANVTVARPLKTHFSSDGDISKLRVNFMLSAQF